MQPVLLGRWLCIRRLAVHVSGLGRSVPLLALKCILPAWADRARAAVYESGRGRPEQDDLGEDVREEQLQVAPVLPAG